MLTTSSTHGARPPRGTARRPPRRPARARPLPLLLALDLDESDYALAVAELGMEVDPAAPYSPSGWLTLVAERLESPRADYGPDAGQ
ncbi:hypothetical protein OG585_27630 [Streptomyces sp. NBC_01340]|uniref:hypothetical protein n=1 Tax=unclassified Streptomyces TaxID=2593676 RepID=UPI0022575725|nr:MULTISPECIES: hypothetical protein [unclassified Streptomyces]MCX4456353.1 hypothetical protein [Streptomyces sp. NBC_01719]MCX4495711.1 hypothetical protein [Streptomyces sp. NBC_01728]MCX4589707.1 hypothetical protein [Streptomyces sp. NBC_01549]WSI44576.1 hypothetical protein OG585_27630 [Streptomyces sp. NBC_01340]